MAVKRLCLENIGENHDYKPTATVIRLLSPPYADRTGDPRASITSDKGIEVEDGTPSQTQDASAITAKAEGKDEVLFKELVYNLLNKDQNNTSSGVLHNSQDGVQPAMTEATGNSISQCGIDAAAENSHEAMTGLGLSNHKQSRWTAEEDKELLEYCNSGMSIAAIAEKLTPVRRYLGAQRRLKYLRARRFLLNDKNPGPGPYQPWTTKMKSELMAAKASGYSCKQVQKNVFPERSIRSVGIMWRKLQQSKPRLPYSSSTFKASATLYKGVQADELATRDPTDNLSPAFAVPVDPPATETTLDLKSDSSQTGPRPKVPDSDDLKDGYEMPVHNDSHKHGVDTLPQVWPATKIKSVKEGSGLEEERSVGADLYDMEYEHDTKIKKDKDEGEEEEEEQEEQEAAASGLVRQETYVKKEEQQEILGFETANNTVDDRNIPVAVASLNVPSPSKYNNWSARDMETLLVARQNGLPYKKIPPLLQSKRTLKSVRRHHSDLVKAAQSMRTRNGMEWTQNMDSFLVEARARRIPIEEIVEQLPFKVLAFDVVARLYFHSGLVSSCHSKARWTPGEEQKLLAAFDKRLTADQICDGKIIDRSFEAVTKHLRL